MGRAHDVALLQDETVAPHRVGDDAADALARPERGRISRDPLGLRRFSERSGFLRSAAMISPRIETAISAGLTAPMSRPIGAWMRAISSALETLRREASDAIGVGFSRAERADVETFGAQRRGKAGIVDPRIVGQQRTAPYSGRAAAAARRRPAIRRSARTSGKRAGVAKAVRGSTITTSKSASFAIGASAWLM